MAKLRITVLKRMFNQDLADTYSTPGTEVCGRFEDGQQFIVEGLDQPAGFCAWAWNDIHKAVLTLQKEGTFKSFMRADNNIIACCTDGIRPVVFNVERIAD